MIIENHADEKISSSLDMALPYYLMASYAYYEESDPIFSDDYYDNLAKKILDNWDNIQHYHKNLLNKDMLKAGTFIGEYPSIVKDALKNMRECYKHNTLE